MILILRQKHCFFLQNKEELHTDIWYVVMSSIHRMSPPASARIFFLFILSLECCFVIISSFLLNAQPRFCTSTFHPLLSVRSVGLLHRWCESAEALRLAADSQSILLAFQVLDQPVEFNWGEWLVRESVLWFELPWSRDVREIFLVPEGIIT